MATDTKPSDGKIIVGHNKIQFDIDDTEKKAILIERRENGMPYATENELPPRNMSFTTEDLLQFNSSCIAVETNKIVVARNATGTIDVSTLKYLVRGIEFHCSDPCGDDISIEVVVSTLKLKPKPFRFEGTYCFVKLVDDPTDCIINVTFRSFSDNMHIYDLAILKKHCSSGPFKVISPNNNCFHHVDNCNKFTTGDSKTKLYRHDVKWDNAANGMPHKTKNKLPKEGLAIDTNFAKFSSWFSAQSANSLTLDRNKYGSIDFKMGVYGIGFKASEIYDVPFTGTIKCTIISAQGDVKETHQFENGSFIGIMSGTTGISNITLNSNCALKITDLFVISTKPGKSLSDSATAVSAKPTVTDGKAPSVVQEKEKENAELLKKIEQLILLQTEANSKLNVVHDDVKGVDQRVGDLTEFSVATAGAAAK